MTFCIAVFRSKPQVFEFLNGIKAQGVWAEITQTPKESGVGCGLSVKFQFVHIRTAQKVLAVQNPNSFFGFYKVEKVGNRTSVHRL